MSRKLKTVVTLIFASAVFGSMAQSALADWLVEGAAIKETLATTSEQEVKFEDSKTPVGKVAVLCKLIFDGTVSPEEKDEITEILNTAKEKIGELGGLGLLCTSVSTCEPASEASPIEVWPDHLPWLSKIETVGTEEYILDRITGGGTGEPGWELLCLVLGITSEDTCTGAVGAKMDGTAETGLLSILSAEAGKETCTQSSEASGSETGEGKVSLTSGEHLGVLVCLSAAAAEYESLFWCLASLGRGLYTNGYNDVPFGG
jgi:hypothetical protein